MDQVVELALDVLAHGAFQADPTVGTPPARADDHRAFVVKPVGFIIGRRHGWLAAPSPHAPTHITETQLAHTTRTRQLPRQTPQTTQTLRPAPQTCTPLHISRQRQRPLRNPPITTRRGHS